MTPRTTSCTATGRMSISTSRCKVLLPYIRHLHLPMAPGWMAKGLQIGEGTIDWVHFFRVIGDYHGTMIPEIWRGHQRQGEGFLIAIQRLSEAYFTVQGR